MHSTLSPEGKCFSYDARASGFGKGEGAVCIIIKRLSDAIACGDPVRAVIRNTACDHSGRTPGISMPSRSAQEKLLTRLHHDIRVPPTATTFVEVRPWLRTIELRNELSSIFADCSITRLDFGMGPWNGHPGWVS